MRNVVLERFKYSITTAARKNGEALAVFFLGILRKENGTARAECRESPFFDGLNVVPHPLNPANDITFVISEYQG